MGVPAFFRWLSRKYPSIVVHCKEDRRKEIDGVKVPVDLSQPNLNDVEFDNLYLDMNGIIHPCSHPENKPAPKNEDEMMKNIFEYIDRLMAIVRPRRLLYMAIDGVAPRAKMNQQRSRRFRASKETKEKIEEISKVKDELRMKGMQVPPDKPAGEHFDSNCITPGTEFMFHLAKCLRYYIHLRQNTDPLWANIIVILSDANVPGEGEHKIMDYIRRQRAQPNHDPNTHHCLCGADADLIMLGLATHEPYFTIIREEFKPNAVRPCEICGQDGHELKECMGLARVKQGEFDEKPLIVNDETEFIFIRLNILREYLYKELNMTNLPFKQDIERAIDDWVLMCFFVGNDFLPHLPSLEIREGAIDRLIGLYKKVVYKTGGYLTDSGIVFLDRVQLMLTDLGEMEDAIFKKRKETEQEFQRRNDEKKKRQRRSEYDAPRWVNEGQFAPVALGKGELSRVVPLMDVGKSIRDVRQQGLNMHSNEKAAKELKSLLNENEILNAQGNKRKLDPVEETEEPNDEVRLWEDGWKERYYINKFGVDAEDYDFRYKVANEYVQGICWVLKYYYQGCVSWDWYFPYHYAPFASDFTDIGKLNVVFPSDTKPFKPLEQLMSVFPAASKQFLPPTWRTLMEDPDSPIIDFYPTNFKVDLNGKKYAWQGVALLPFVDEERLLEVLELVYKDVSTFESLRNIRDNDRLYVHKNHSAHTFLEALYEGGYSNIRMNLNPSLSSGIAGLIWCDEKAILTGDLVKSPLPQYDDLNNNQVISVLYKDPEYKPDFIFPARVLKGVKVPPPVLKQDDFKHNYPGQPYNNFRSQTGFAQNNKYSNFHNAEVAKRHIENNLPKQQFSSQNSQSFQKIPPPNSYNLSGNRGFNSGSNKNNGSNNYGSSFSGQNYHSNNNSHVSGLSYGHNQLNSRYNTVNPNFNGTNQMVRTNNPQFNNYNMNKFGSNNNRSGFQSTSGFNNVHMDSSNYVPRQGNNYNFKNAGNNVNQTRFPDQRDRGGYNKW